MHARSDDVFGRAPRLRAAPVGGAGHARVQAARVPARIGLVLLTMLLLLAQPPALAQQAPFEDTLAQRLLACTGCHGKDGRSVGNVYFPRIAGKPAGYLYNQLRNFRDGRRSYRLMTGMVQLLGDDYLREIAEHFAALDLPYPAPPAANLSPQAAATAQALVERGDAQRQLPACSSCHGTALTGVAPHVPGLLGLPRDYLNAQLGAWRSGQRHAAAPDCMAQVARALTVDEVASVSAWLAAQALPSDTHAVAADRLPGPAAQRPACGSAPELAGAAR